MDEFRPLIPRQPAPPLEVSVSGGSWRLADQNPPRLSRFPLPYLQQLLGGLTTTPERT